MSPVACSDLVPGCSICSWDPVSIHSKSGTSPLGRCEENNTYLGNMKNLWLTFGRCGNMILDGFCDADWAGQPHRHLISGYSFHIGTGAITWSSKKQYIVALSSTEAEYIMQTHTAKEVMYLHAFVQEIRGLDKLIAINCNNQGAIGYQRTTDSTHRPSTLISNITSSEKQLKMGKLHLNIYQLMKTQWIYSPNHLQRANSAVSLNCWNSRMLM